MRGWKHPAFWLVAACVMAACASSGSSNAPSSPRCSADADCRLFSDYCDGCACRALDRAAADPTCKGTMVQCLLDPCQGKSAVCAAGACTLAPPSQ
jgi:hypothetical protein